jgi:hypothetical protein
MTERWYLANIRMLERLFNRVLFDDIAFQWILIHRFPLPPIFNKNDSSLLIKTPGANIQNHSGYQFYLDIQLSRKDLNNFKHIFEGGSYNDLRAKGYSKLSFHLQSFRPSYDFLNGDNLVDITQAVYNFLGQKSGV